jgi:hypothetical protein
MNSEELCMDCGGPNVVPWWTSADRWRPFVTAKYGHDMILCPQCFVRCWEEQTGLVAIWRLEPDPASIRDKDHDEWVAQQGHDALVQAVRDADTLRQARELVAEIENYEEQGLVGDAKYRLGNLFNLLTGSDG